MSDAHSTFRVAEGERGVAVLLRVSPRSVLLTRSALSSPEIRLGAGCVRSGYAHCPPSRRGSAISGGLDCADVVGAIRAVMNLKPTARQFCFFFSRSPGQWAIIEFSCQHAASSFLFYWVLWCSRGSSAQRLRRGVVIILPQISSATAR